jgi:hypothetical protein
MTTQPDLFQLPTQDISARRHGGDENSRAAHDRMLKQGRLAAQQGRVLEAIRQAGQRGLTCMELAKLWSVGMNQISGRFTELLKSGKIRRTAKRGGGWVHQA